MHMHTHIDIRKATKKNTKPTHWNHQRQKSILRPEDSVL